MLLNKFPLNTGVLGSGAPVNTVLGIASLVVRAVGTAKATMVAYAKGSTTVTASGTAHSRVTIYGKISGVGSAVGTVTARVAVHAYGTVTQVVSATGTVLAHVYHKVYGSGSTVVRAVGNVYGRYATRGTITATPTAHCSAKSSVIQHGTATCVVYAECVGHVPWSAAPDERTFALTAGDRTFILPKD